MRPPRRQEPHARQHFIGGKNVLVNELPDGSIISFRARREKFLHPYLVTLQGGRAATIRAGLINGIVPTIGEIPLDADRPPVLRWTRPKIDDDGRGWIALEATFGKKWEVLSAIIVQVGSLDTDDGEPSPPPKADDTAPAGYSGGAPLTLSGRRARHPLALLKLRASGQLACFQCTRFDLNHRAQVIDETKQLARHFFFAAG